MDDSELKIRYLGWAAVELELDGVSFAIDPMLDNDPLEPFTGELHREVHAPSAGTAAAVAVTHLHSDHADPGTIRDALAADGVALRPAPASGEGLETIALLAAENGFADLEIPQRHLEPWETFEAGPFTATAVPAVDGFGDPQVSWVVEAGGIRILQCGDTLFHGSWWLIAMRCGPIDVAFLPVNGPIVSLPHRQPPSPFAAAMSPEQAAAAAAIVGAKLAVPIHYDTINNPPTYSQVNRPAETFLEEAEKAGVEAAIVETGAYVALPA